MKAKINQIQSPKQQIINAGNNAKIPMMKRMVMKISFKISID